MIPKNLLPPDSSDDEPRRSSSLSCHHWQRYGPSCLFYPTMRVPHSIHDNPLWAWKLCPNDNRWWISSVCGDVRKSWMTLPERKGWKSQYAYTIYIYTYIIYVPIEEIWYCFINHIILLSFICKKKSWSRAWCHGSMSAERLELKSLKWHATGTK